MYVCIYIYIYTAREGLGHHRKGNPGIGQMLIKSLVKCLMSDNSIIKCLSSA